MRKKNIYIDIDSVHECVHSSEITFGYTSHERTHLVENFHLKYKILLTYSYSMSISNILIRNFYKNIFFYFNLSSFHCWLHLILVAVISVFFFKPTIVEKPLAISFYCIGIVLLFVQSKFLLKQPISIAEKYKKNLINRYITTEEILILSRDETKKKKRIAIHTAKLNIFGMHFCF